MKIETLPTSRQINATPSSNNPSAVPTYNTDANDEPEATTIEETFREALQQTLIEFTDTDPCNRQRITKQIGVNTPKIIKALKSLLNEYTVNVTSTIAEREHRKWESAPPIPDNPYSPEKISERLRNLKLRRNAAAGRSRGSGSDTSIDFPEFHSESETSEMAIPTLTINCGGKDLNPKKYGRDYYINSSGESKRRVMQYSDEREKRKLPERPLSSIDKKEEELEGVKKVSSPTGAEAALLVLEREALRGDVYHASYRPRQASNDFVLNPLYSMEGEAEQSTDEFHELGHYLKPVIQPHCSSSPQGTLESGYSSCSADSFFDPSGGRLTSPSEPEPIVETRLESLGSLHASGTWRTDVAEVKLMTIEKEKSKAEDQMENDESLQSFQPSFDEEQQQANEENLAIECFSETPIEILDERNKQNDSLIINESQTTPCPADTKILTNGTANGISIPGEINGDLTKNGHLTFNKVSTWNENRQIQEYKKESIAQTSALTPSLPSVRQLALQFSSAACPGVASKPPIIRRKKVQKEVVIVKKVDGNESKVDSPKQVHSLTARSISREFREGLRQNQQIPLGKPVANTNEQMPSWKEKPDKNDGEGNMQEHLSLPLNVVPTFSKSPRSLDGNISDDYSDVTNGVHSREGSPSINSLIDEIDGPLIRSVGGGIAFWERKSPLGAPANVYQKDS
ncbi:hypothetical protein J437_LFUL004672 [Ladona fulva]|uniref:Uncharacterized protein n=1 Tax=Ladona fulva TaxID=123851 RepID=A0A8K0KS46_LADFU|nr:hypothetical protein J437_LFUL004672 [Ladona fulva]